MQNHPSPVIPSKEDLTFLHNFLSRSEGGISTIYAIHGFLTAIISTPIDVPANEWLPVLLNIDPTENLFSQKPIFLNEEEAPKVILGFHNLKEYITHVLKSNDLYYPLVSIDNPKLPMFEADPAHAAEWCNGYLHAVDRYLQAWSSVKNVFVPLVPFAVVSGMYPYEELVKGLDQFLDKNADMKYNMETIPKTVKSLYRYWQVNRYRDNDKNFKPSDDLKKSFKNWNEACKCGSGKRFGECCLQKDIN